MTPNISKTIKIVDFNPSYQHAFKALNEEWITKYFVMEDADFRALDHPKAHILDKGGYIAIALLEEMPVGTCALMKMENGQFDYELAKMGVSPKAQGLGVGYQLGTKVILKAREFGAKNIFLESNTILGPAIRLYKKLGFKEIDHIKTPYKRCNIQMELVLK
ncbi:MAG: GNAT family N-acetyltransferase [Bacteroidota bacterium]